MTRRELANAIYATAHLTGTFQLRSGATPWGYFDKYRFEGDPRLLTEIARAMVALVPSGTDAFAGLELGGVPLAVQLSQVTGLPTLFVRKIARAHGLSQVAEGGATEGRTILLVEDVVGSASEVIEAAEALRGIGAVITGAVCVIDRDEGATEALAAMGIQLRALFRMSDFTGTDTRNPG